LRGFLGDVARATTPALRIVDRDAIEGELLALFHDPARLASRDLGAVRSYLGEDAPSDGDAAHDAGQALDRRRAQLAATIAQLFDEYAYSRPEMLEVWRRGALVAGVNEPVQRWQRELWLALFGRAGVFAPDAALTLPDFFARTPAEVLRPPASAHVFGISFVARLYRSIFAALGRASSLYVYAQNPCREYWEDLQPSRRKRPDARFPRRRGDAQLGLFDGAAPGSTAGEPAAAQASDAENPLLALWGRPGRDSMRLYNQLSECDFDARFVEPAGGDARAPLLATLQQEVLDRAPREAKPVIADGSVVMFAAPDPRRELETVAAEIWSLLRADGGGGSDGAAGAHRPLRFDDIAVVAPAASAATYLPLAREVFASAARIPHTVLGLPSPAEGHLLEAIELVLALPGGPLGRRDLLRLAMHPTVARRFPDVDPEDFLALAEELGIVHGAGRRDLEGSYLTEDRVSWDQGLKRLALGAFLSGRRSGEERPFALDGEPVLAAELPAALEPAARALALIVRPLIDFALTARAAPALLADHLALLRRTLAATIHPDTPDEEAALGDAFGTLERIGASAPPDLRVGFAVVAELVRDRLAAGHLQARQRAPEGVTVAAFAPLHALPFRVIFAVGLDERVFPSAEGFRTLDLRAAARQPGDVTPREQDEYMFLETLLAARERLYLSYVRRDAATGERKDPSSALIALRDVLRGAEALVRPDPPLLRSHDDDVCAVIPAAAAERRAAATGRSLRRAAAATELPDIARLRDVLAPDAWAALAAQLGVLELSPAGAAPSAPRKRDTLTLASLRRFLECPLQGSVSVLLPMGDEGDADADAEAAMRERENLDDNRGASLPMLRDVLARALAAGGDGSDDDALARQYDEAAAGLRLDATLPGGLFGVAIRARHLDLLRCWRDGLRVALKGDLPAGLAPIWLGAAPEHRRDVDLRAAVPLSVPLAAGAASMALIGCTEPIAIAPGERTAITLTPAVSRSHYLERDLLRGWLTHLALSAAGIGAGEKLNVAVIRPKFPGSPSPEVKQGCFRPIDAAEARALLAELAAELLAGVFPYLLPCEGVFTWWKRRGKDNELTVREAVLLLRDDNFTRLSSDRGPIADARRYPVPATADADDIVARRFQPYFDGFGATS
jgi:exodeoxyribonuclease V gamma subunit